MVRRVSIEQSDVYCVETEAKPSAAGQTKELEQNVQRYVHFLFPVCLSKGLTSPFYRWFLLVAERATRFMDATPRAVRPCCAGTACCSTRA